jgi:hypothetical protein
MKKILFILILFFTLPVGFCLWLLSALLHLNYLREGAEDGLKLILKEVAA